MKKLLVLVVAVFLTVTGLAQSHFTVDFTGNGQDHMILNILSATVDGVALQSGDEIAAFDGTVCCGKVVLTQPIVITNMNTFIAIAASKKDIGFSNGFTEGDVITFKLWDSSANKEIFLISTEYLNPSTAQPITAPIYTANASASVKLTGRINKVPVSNAGTDQTINESSSVTLNGSASSDLDNDPLTYSWTAPSGITLSSTSVAKPTFTAPEVATDTPYTFSLVVNDGFNNSTTDQVIIIIKQVNKVPVAKAGTDKTFIEGLPVILDGSASSDADNNTLTYLWTAPTGITLGSNTASKPTFTAPEVTKDTQYTFSLVVNDGYVNSPADLVILTIKQSHFQVAFTGNGQDQMNLHVVTATFDGIKMEIGDEIAAFDDTICCGRTILTEPVNLTDINTFVSIASSKKDEGLLNGFTVGNTITYKFWDVSKNQELTGIKPEYIDYSTLLTTATPLYTANASAFVKLIGTTNRAPVSNAGVDQVVYKGETVTLNGSLSSDPDIDVLNYKWTAPAGITLNSTTVSKPTFTAPKVVNDTKYTFTLVVNDGKLNSTVDQIEVTVIRKIFTQKIALVSGWNILSSNVTPDNADMKSVTQSLINDGTLSKVMDESGKAIENFAAFGGWKNSIGNFRQTEGYRILMNSADTLTIEGEAIPLPLDITLSSGWNIISYPCSESQNASTILQSLINGGKLKKVNDESGKAIEDYGIYGGWKNNIGNLNPGKGFRVLMSGSDTLTIISTVLRAASTSDAPTSLESSYFTKIYEGNGSNHMNINLVNLSTSPLKAGNEIGIFDGDYCVGTATIGSSQMADGSISIPASCNDGQNQTVNGFIPGHSIGIKLYSDGSYYNLTVENLLGSDTFEKDGSLFAKVLSKDLTNLTTNISKNEESVQIGCYPNPFMEEISIDFKNNVSTDLYVGIYNLSGQRIKGLYKGKTDLIHLEWNGTDEKGNKVVPGVYLCKINNTTKKIIFTSIK